MATLKPKRINIIHSEKDRRVFIIYFFSFTGIISLLFFGIKGIIDNRLTYCIIIFSFFTITLSNLLYFFVTKKLAFASYMVLFLMFVLELALFAFLGHGITGLFWYYVLPPLAIMFLENKKGTVMSVLLVVATLFMQYLPNNIMINEYPKEVLIRFIFTYIVVVTLINIYEFSRIKAYKAYLKALSETQNKNQEIMQQKDELHYQSEQLSANNKELELKNIQIIDSIEYAKLIQDAILPSADQFEKSFSEFFVFYKPKDIVSGDFYWFYTRNQYMYLAVVDCTGHGVAGAFMSMIGNTLLNEIIRKYSLQTPCEILVELNKKILLALKQGGENLDSDGDGMDISLIRIDKLKNEILFAGANHNMLIISPDNFKILHGDPFSLGGLLHKRVVCNYENQAVQFQPNTYLYLFTDGYSDQFGGANNEKLHTENFYKLISQIAISEMKNQKELLEVEFSKWKGNHMQIDDITVIGVKL